MPLTPEQALLVADTYTSAEVDAKLATLVPIKNPLKANNTWNWTAKGTLKITHDDGTTIEK